MAQRESGKPWQLKPFCGLYRLIPGSTTPNHRQFLKEIGYTDAGAQAELQCSTTMRIRVEDAESERCSITIKGGHEQHYEFKLGATFDVDFVPNTENNRRQMELFFELIPKPWKLCTNFFAKRRDHKNFMIIHEFRGTDLGDKIVSTFVCDDTISGREFVKQEQDEEGNDE